MAASGTLSVIPTKEDLIAQHQQQQQSTSGVSTVTDYNNQEEKDTFTKCEVDPVKAQDDAMISVALKIRDGKMAVNEYSVDEARTTMVRSNYAPDWTSANWNHPLLANLKNLSCLSSFDLPSHTKRGLVDERKAIKYGEERRSSASENENETKERQLIVAPSENENESKNNYTKPEEVRNEIIEKEALEYALSHRTPAVIETSPFLLSQKALMDLSPETIGSDPQLLALVSAVAKANKTDPRIAGKVAMGETPTIPVEILTPSIKNTYPVHRKATDALPKPTIGNYNKGFHDSDIVAYSKMKDELSPDSKNSRLMIEEPQEQQQEEGNTSSSSPPSASKKSMHDVGYQTWMQKHLDQPAEYEDRERFAEYRDQVTSLEGKCLSVSEKK